MRGAQRHAAALDGQSAGCSKDSGSAGKGDIRVTTAFNRLLRLPGAAVIDVSFGLEGVIVTVRLAGGGSARDARRPAQESVFHDRRARRWRRLDLGSARCVIECEVGRVWCPDCGAQPAGVPWARSGSRYTRDFEDTAAWLAQQMAKSQIARLLRIGWDSVGGIVERVVAEHLDEQRLAGLVAIGVDEISYRRGQRYLTSVVDHEAGAIVWCQPGRNAATLRAFFDEVGPQRVKTIRAVSIDMSGGYEKAIRENAPQAEVCFDPFHVVAVRHEALLVRAGCKTPPSGCRGSPVKLRAV